MIITIKTKISFDNVKDYDSIQRFIENNDITKWVKDVDTLMTSFTMTKTYYQEVKDNGGTY